MSKEADKVKHLKKRDKEKKKAERKVNETINKEELAKIHLAHSLEDGIASN